MAKHRRKSYKNKRGGAQQLGMQPRMGDPQPGMDPRMGDPYMEEPGMGQTNSDMNINSADNVQSGMMQPAPGATTDMGAATGQPQTEPAVVPPPTEPPKSMKEQNKECKKECDEKFPAPKWWEVLLGWKKGGGRRRSARTKKHRKN